MMVGCATPKAVVEHHYHESEVDTMAVQAQVDKRLSDWREVMIKEVSVAIQSQQTEQNTQEQERERVTETITTWVDSLGREMRQEQRTTERDISRQQQLREQRMQQAWESRLQQVTDSLNAEWQENFSRLQAHWAEADSTDTEVTPVVTEKKPWWKRVGDLLMGLLGIAAAFVVLAWVVKTRL